MLILYRLPLHDNVHTGQSCEWLMFVKTIFDDSGLTYTLQSQCFNGSTSMLLTRIETIENNTKKTHIRLVPFIPNI